MPWTNRVATRADVADGSRFARLWPLVWVVWLPILAEPIAALLRRPGAVPPPQLLADLASLAAFVAIYVWAAWHNDVSRPPLVPGVPGALWLPTVALTGIGLALTLDNKVWVLLFIYASASAGARRPRVEAAAAVAVLTLLTIATGLLGGVAWADLGRTVFLVAVVGAMVMGLGWTVTTNRASRIAVAAGEGTAGEDAAVIRTPDQRVRVFVSSTLDELASERDAARAAVGRLHLTPILFELGARPHPPQALYRSYLAQSDLFIGIYWQRYGWIAPEMDISGLEDEYRLAAEKPKLIYVKKPAPEREPRLGALLDRIRDDNVACYKSFTTPGQLRRLIENDLALVLSERFVSAAGPASRPADRPVARPGDDGTREPADA
jgi:hypothetical protein